MNVLRHALNSSSTEEAAREVATIESNGILDDYGVAKANDKASLQSLHEILKSSPILSHLMSRIFLWYDYSCVPQPPRSESEEAVFRQGLQYLNSIQILGRTMVLLDDVEDYVSRAWCTLEAINADQFQSIDVMIGSQRKTGRKGLIEYFFDNLLQDRPHIVWRGVLDTEVFRLQTPIECMRRLGLKTTDERDLPYIYSNLCKLDAPTKIHVDDSELVTGAFPLPIVDNGESVLWDKDLGVAVQKDEGQNHHRQSLDWTNVLNIQESWNREDHVNACNVPSFQKFELETRSPPEEEARSRCHIAVVGSCEGEAVVFSNWARKHRSDLELLMNTQITSLSWLASDIAPVGHFVYGKLNAVAVEADMYVVLTLSVRFVHCNLTRLLTDLFRHAAGKTFAFSVDKAENNVLTLSSAIKQPVDDPKPHLPNKIRLTGTGTRFSSHLGGLFSPTVKQYLVQVKNESEGG